MNRSIARQTMGFAVAGALFFIGLSSLTSFAKDKTEAQPPCLFCDHSKHNSGTSRIDYGSGKSYLCPLGRAPVRRYCAKLEGAIAKVVGKGHAKCYSNLFALESSCSITVPHDPKKAHNPHAGLGLCAIEKSPLIRQQNRRGPACEKIATLDDQIKCCAHLMTSTKGNYFGTVRCGNVPRCGG